MTSHIWGDGWEYWQELDEALVYIQDYVYKYGRCRLSAKEKYGTLRYEYLYPAGITYWVSWYIPSPFLTKCQMGSYRKCLWSFEGSIFYRLWRFYGKYILNKAINSAILKFPNVRKEILADYEVEWL